MFIYMIQEPFRPKIEAFGAPNTADVTDLFHRASLNSAETKPKKLLIEELPADDCNADRADDCDTVSRDCKTETDDYVLNRDERNEADNSALCKDIDGANTLSKNEKLWEISKDSQSKSVLSEADMELEELD